VVRSEERVLPQRAQSKECGVRGEEYEGRAIRRMAFPGLVEEVAHVGEEHGEAQAVGGGDYFGVFYGAAGLDNGGGAGLGGFFHAVGEGEEGVGGYDRSLQGVLRFHYGEFDGIDAAHLTGAHADGGTIFCEDDGVGFYVLADFPGEFQVG